MARTDTAAYHKAFADGYKEGMSDIQDVIDNGGTIDDVQAWVTNNTRPTPN